MIGSYYFDSIKSKNFTYKIENQTIEISLDVKSIHGHIEQDLKVFSRSNAKDKDNTVSFNDQFDFNIRYAPDKLYDTIKNKLSRKANEVNESKIP